MLTWRGWVFDVLRDVSTYKKKKWDVLFFLGQFLWASASGRQAMSTFFQLWSTTLPVAKLLQLSPWPARSYNACFCHHGVVLHTIYFCPRFSNRSSGQQFEGAGQAFESCSHSASQQRLTFLRDEKKPSELVVGKSPLSCFLLTYWLHGLEWMRPVFKIGRRALS